MAHNAPPAVVTYRDAKHCVGTLSAGRYRQIEERVREITEDAERTQEIMRCMAAVCGLKVDDPAYDSSGLSKYQYARERARAAEAGFSSVHQYRKHLKELKQAKAQGGASE